MKIVLINGGLGNQVFQYIFGRYLEIETGEKVFFDDSYFHMDFLNDYSRHNDTQDIPITFYWMEKLFGIKLNTLSDYFTPDVWKYMIDTFSDDTKKILDTDDEIRAKFAGTNATQISTKNTLQQLRDNGMDIAMVTEMNDYNFDGNIVWLETNQYSPHLVLSKGNLYFHGCWINKNYFWKYRDLFRKELAFPPITDEKNLQFAKEIYDSDSVSIHIRHFTGVQILHLNKNFYIKSLELFRERIPQATYFVFSDGLSEVKEHFYEYGFKDEDHVVFVEGNESAFDNYKDLQLMSMCKNMIIANSSFSYLAYLLNKNTNILVLNPTDRET